MKFTLFELWAHMGVGARLIAGTMLLMSLASIVIVCERVALLSRSSKQSMNFARKLAELLGEGDLDRAAHNPIPGEVGHLGRVLQAALRTYQSSPKGDAELTFDSVARVLERQAQREVLNMKRGVGVLANVASTAPFVGLLGTVLGIVNSFELMAESGSGGLSTVSAGIAEALATTALGLLVAIRPGSKRAPWTSRRPATSCSTCSRATFARANTTPATRASRSAPRSPSAWSAEPWPLALAALGLALDSRRRSTSRPW